MGYRVEGFTFGTEEEARLAKKEAEGIKYILGRNDMEDPGTVLRLYNRLIEKEVFSTPVGFRFLGELRSGLLKLPYMQAEHLRPLPTGQPGKPAEKKSDPLQAQAAKSRAVEAEDAEEEDAEEEDVEEEKSYYRPFLVSTFFAVVFALALLGVFIITAVSKDNTTILNYENSLIDKYESWDRQLTERERELERREAELRGTEPVTESMEDTAQ
ncbi:MAG: hypothetical protein NC180_04925 [Muribaculaceae bacterium]|nr:hypothetical protein [Roseburia sp.]MCM1431131.1 hypothetical protein [Muribaculaceae bacterium]MCM1492554.1 hypothetical protein [Muribaculaceae bacterium]